MALEELGYTFVADASTLLRTLSRTRSTLQSVFSQTFPPILEGALKRDTTALQKLSKTTKEMVGQSATLATSLKNRQVQLVREEKGMRRHVRTSLASKRVLDDVIKARGRGSRAADMLSSSIARHVKLIDVAAKKRRTLKTHIKQDEEARDGLSTSIALNTMYLKAGVTTLEEYQNRMILISTASIAAGTALVALTGAVTILAAKFDWAMREVATILDAEALPALGRLRTDILGVSVAFGLTAADSAKAMYQILSAQVPVAHATHALQIAAMGAKAGFTDLFTAADALTTVMNSYNMAQSDAQRVMDVLFATVRKGKITFGELSNQIGRVAAISSMAGSSFEELSALIATATRSGLRSGIAMTSIGAVFRDFLKPSMDAQLVAWRDFGVELTQEAIAVEGVIGVLKKLEGATGTQLAKMFAQIRAHRVVAALMENLTGLERDLLYMRQRAGLTVEAYSRINDALFFQLQRVGSGLHGVAIGVGHTMKLTKAFSAVVKPLADFLQEIVRALSDVEKHPVTAFLVRTTAATVAFGVAVASLKGALYLLVPAIKLAVPKMALFGAGTLATLTYVGLAIAALGALYAVIDKLIVTTKERIRALDEEIDRGEAAISTMTRMVEAYEKLMEEQKKLTGAAVSGGLDSDSLRLKLQLAQVEALKLVTEMEQERPKLLKGLSGEYAKILKSMQAEQGTQEHLKKLVIIRLRATDQIIAAGASRLFKEKAILAVMEEQAVRMKAFSRESWYQSDFADAVLEKRQEVADLDKIRLQREQQALELEKQLKDLAEGKARDAYKALTYAQKWMEYRAAMLGTTKEIAEYEKFKIRAMKEALAVQGGIVDIELALLEAAAKGGGQVEHMAAVRRKTELEMKKAGETWLKLREDIVEKYGVEEEVGKRLIAILDGLVGRQMDMIRGAGERLLLERQIRDVLIATKSDQEDLTAAYESQVEWIDLALKAMQASGSFKRKELAYIKSMVTFQKEMSGRQRDIEKLRSKGLEVAKKLTGIMEDGQRAALEATQARIAASIAELEAQKRVRKTIGIIAGQATRSRQQAEETVKALQLGAREFADMMRGGLTIPAARFEIIKEKDPDVHATALSTERMAQLQLIANATLIEIRDRPQGLTE